MSSAPVAGTAALRAACGTVEGDLLIPGEARQTKLAGQFGQGAEGLPAAPAQGPDQPLGGNAVQGRGDEIIVQTHVHQPGDAGGGAVGVQRRQHEVTGQGCLGRDLGRRQVADLADQDDVRVLAQDVTEYIGEIQPDRRLDLDLVDAVELVLDRVLDGDDLDLGRVQPDQGRVERGRLPLPVGPVTRKIPSGCSSPRR